MSGILALVGGRPFTEGCTFDADLLAASGGDEVVILPTAAAYEHPDREVESATAHFSALGGRVTGLDLLTRRDALGADLAARVRDARFLYLVGGSPMHLRSVVKDSPVWDALVAAWEDGAVVAAASGAARVLCDPMVDPRGGAFTVGLGLLDNLAVVPHHNHWSEEKAHRTLLLAPAGLLVVGIDDATALLRAPDGTWQVAGAGSVAVFRSREDVGLEALPTA
ncbi:MAG: Type 1 glutamine amidotransferase-like domain-containing protein [Acidimicrobiales bacterium]